MASLRCSGSTLCLLSALAGALPAAAQATDPVGDLHELSLEQLGDIRITSVSKRPERLSDAAASVYVITADEIRRSGVGNLPEALRLAPNLQVAQQSSRGYAISARGFNGSNNSSPNKLLVMIDGRSVYSPLFSGVFWDVQDLMLEDVERIEVISGPGGTLWGVNAVNGVINVVTKAASDTRSSLLAATAGELDSTLAFRYGDDAGNDGSYRVYAKFDNRRHTRLGNGLAVDDAGHKAQVGFRYDRQIADSYLQLSGNAYRALEGQPAPGSVSVTGTTFLLDDIELSGANLSAKWQLPLDGGGMLELQGWYDHTSRVVPPTFGERLDLLDLQLQHSPRPHGRHQLAWGLSYRHSRDRIDNSLHFAFLPARVQQTWLSAFVQDEVALREDLRLIVGARLERNDYTGTEFLPSARVAWNLHPEHLLWAAASRAVRAPSRLDRDARIPGVPPFLLDGGPDARSEIADVYELGYRGRFGSRLSLSATAFHARYRSLRTLELAPTMDRVVFGNGMRGLARGIEAWARLQLTPRWRLSAAYTHLDETLTVDADSFDQGASAAAGNDPRHTWQLGSSWNFGASGNLDLGLRHVGELRRNSVPAYTAGYARAGWELKPGLEFSLAAHNLGAPHAEYGSRAFRTEFEPVVMAKLVWDR